MLTLESTINLGPLLSQTRPNFREFPASPNINDNFQALRTFGNISAVAGIPAFDRHPGHDLAILLHDLALVVHEDQRVVRRLVGMFLVPFTGERKYAPYLGFAAGRRENRRFIAR